MSKSSKKPVEPEFMSLQKAATYLDCSEYMVRTLIAGKKIPAYNLSDSPLKRLWRIKRSDLDKFMLSMIDTA